MLDDEEEWVLMRYQAASVRHTYYGVMKRKDAERVKVRTPVIRDEMWTELACGAEATMNAMRKLAYEGSEYMLSGIWRSGICE